jgi:hypothetical protein
MLRLSSIIFGRLEGIEPSTSAPQTEVLPLNYSRHVFISFITPTYNQGRPPLYQIYDYLV